MMQSLNSFVRWVKANAWMLVTDPRTHGADAMVSQSDTDFTRLEGNWESWERTVGRAVGLCGCAQRKHSLANT